MKFSRQILEKYSNIKFHKNPPIGSRAVPRGRTNMIKLIVPFCNFVNAPKNSNFSCQWHIFSDPSTDACCKNLRLKYGTNRAVGFVTASAVTKRILRNSDLELILRQQDCHFVRSYLRWLSK